MKEKTLIMDILDEQHMLLEEEKQRTEAAEAIAEAEKSRAEAAEARIKELRAQLAAQS
ncbi:MAG: hypothetical protein IJ873_03965 [Lachnospiraceae bacterium]|nr:hypothetical protein [Lachnospiraceae bacterium]